MQLKDMRYQAWIAINRHIYALAFVDLELAALLANEHGLTAQSKEERDIMYLILGVI